MLFGSCRRVERSPRYVRREFLIARSFAIVASLALLSLLESSGRESQNTVNVYPEMEIAKIVARAPADTTFVFHAGVYRMQRIIPKDRDIFIGEPGAILNGSKLLTSFQHTGQYYWIGGQTHGNYVGINPVHCEAAYPACVYQEDLYFDDKPLVRVATQADVGPGRWFFDYENGTIYFYDDPSTHKVEISATATAFERWNGATGSKANNVIIRGLTIEKYATPGLTGAIGGVSTSFGYPTMGANWVIENNEIRLNHGAGIRVNFGWQILHNYIHHNGNFGMSAGVGGGNPDGSGTDPSKILIEGNEIAYNNYAHVKPQFGAGGAKLLWTRGLVFRGNYSHDNAGMGLWTDTNNYDTLYDSNTIQDNTDEGAFHEISYSATIRNNKLLRNGYIYPSGTKWLYAANLLSSESQGVDAYCNTVEISARGGNGMDIIAQTRGASYKSANNYFHHNTVVFDGDSGFTGAATDNQEANFFRSNRFDYNSYHLPNPGRKAFAWNNAFNSFAQFQHAGQETHGTADAKYTSPVPSVVITSPTDQSAASGTLNVTGTAQDPRATVSRVEFYFDWSLKETQAGSSFDFPFDSTGISAGQHTVAVMAYNAEGVRACYAITLKVP